MEWISNNWFFLLFVALFAGMHFFGFGCCGHRRQGKHKGKEACDKHEDSSSATLPNEKAGKKNHGCCG